MQTIFKGAYWLRFWALQQCEDKMETLRSASKVLRLSL